jgi:hypothetical protein
MPMTFRLLLANQMTGIINLTIRTIYVENALISVGIVHVYMFLVCGVAWLLKDRRIKL